MAEDYERPASLIAGSGRRGEPGNLPSSLARNQERDPCPQCGEADLVPFGAKKRCSRCLYLQPCCNP